MFNTSIVEVAIGLVFVFSLVAILVTQINTMITIALNLRAKQLKQGLKNLVTDQRIRAKLLAHPIINMVDATVPVQAQVTEADAYAIANLKETNVTYIPPSTFVEAMVSILIAESDETLYDPLQQAINAMPHCLEKSQLRELLRALRREFSEENVRKIYSIIDTVTDETQHSGLMTGIQDVENRLQMLRFKSAQLVPLIDGINNIENPHFKSALQTILTAARDLDDARVKLAAWFDDGMNRVSQSFTRRLQVYSLGVAFLLTVILNVDALYFARTLWEDQELRQMTAAAATQFEQPAASVPATPVIPPEGTVVPPEETGETEVSLADLQLSVREAEITIQNLLELQLPMGWQHIPVTQEMIDTSLRLGLPDPRSNPRNFWNFWPGNNSRWLSLLLEKLVGIFATTIAAAQGAPFWFDLLNKIARR